MTQPGKKMEDLMKVLECPVCYDPITEPPIFQCDNLLSHSFCSICHETLQRNGKACPVCQAQLTGRRCLIFENMVETQDLPKKIKCKHDGCDYNRLDEDTVKEHEEDCHHRNVPCCYCDDKIGLNGIAGHVINTHRELVNFVGLSIPEKNMWIDPYNWEKKQIAYKVGRDAQNPAFLFNYNAENDAAPIFWIACVAPKKSGAKRYKYTFQVKNSGIDDTGFIFEGTRPCVPCDLSHEEVRKMGCYLVLDEETIADVTMDHWKIPITVTISKVY